VLRDIATWKDDPELGKLVSRLDKSSGEQLFDTYAEVLVARHLLRQQCCLRVEVCAPSRRSADFEVLRDGLSFFVHVKRLATDGATRKQLDISMRVRSLEKVMRPLVASLSFRWDLRDDEMQLFVKQAKAFLKRGIAGQRTVIKKADGAELGECTIEREWSGDHVKLMIVDHAVRSSDSFSRPHKCLSKAYKQFMPNAVNVILVTRGWSEDTEDFESALLGTERATVLPDGTVEKIERLKDGFWSKQEHPESQVAGWIDPFPSLEGFRSTVWWRSRDRWDPVLERLIAEALKTEEG
jgi:hypothetical protein